MTTMAARDKITERDACMVFAEHGAEMAKEYRLSNIYPALQQALTEAT
jgi:hypothetical protein